MIVQLTTWLFNIAMALLLIFVVTIVAYYYYSRVRTRNYLAKTQAELRYFIQRQVDDDGKVIGYECLLREHTDDNQWRLPQNLETLPLQRVVSLLTDTFKSLQKTDTAVRLSINLEYEQIISPEFDYFVRWAIARIEPLQLNVELTVNTDRRYWQHATFLRHIRQGQAYGMHFAIDNVGSDNAVLDSIQWMLPVVDVLKCSMRNFRKRDGEWLDLNLQFWRQFAAQRNINLVLMGIETAEDVALAKQLDIDLRQGYLFGHPENREQENAPKPEPIITADEQTANEPGERVHQQLYTDDFFAKGHWLLKIWQTLVALFGWVCVIVPLVITIQSFMGVEFGVFKPLWTYSEGIYEIKFIGVIILFTAVCAMIFTVAMSIIQNRKRDRLVEQWPTFNPIDQRMRADELERFMNERFGDEEFRHGVKSYQVQPEQNLDTDAIHELFGEKDIGQI